MESLLKSISSSPSPSKCQEICTTLLNEKLFHLLYEISSKCIQLFQDNLPFKRFNILSRIEIEHDKARIFKDTNDLYDIKSSTPLDYVKALDLQNKCIPSIRDNYPTYPQSIIESIMNSKGKEPMRITFTMTTCKRLDLFVPTMNSFLRCCTDRHLIGRWIIVDDNSSDSDRKEMMRLYPFCEFIFKGPDEKGHPRSMNILRNMVSTPYIFHMEDDWQFIHPAPYISMCMEVLDQNPRYGQCLINKNYSETEANLIRGGLVKFTDKGMGYVEHQHFKNKDELDKYVRSLGGSSVAYWPHYSFRPSLLHKHIWDMDRFREDPCHFEMVHAHKYVEAGYVSTFLPGTYSLHIGKLTSETTTQKANAYALNGVSQFGSALQVNRGMNINMMKNPIMFDSTEEIKNLIRSIPVTKHPKKIQSFCVNLDRRPDRYEKFVSRWTGVERFSAVEGDKLHFTPAEIRMWGMNDHVWNRRIIGCAYSHMKLWKQLLDSDMDAYLIMEDDAIPMKNVEVINRFIGGEFDIEYDILFASYFEWDPNLDIENGGWVNKKDEANIQCVPMKSFSETSAHFMGGTCAYFVSRSGAQKMLNLIDAMGMHNAIDTMIYRLADCGTVMFMYPPLVKSPLANFDGEVDSDIQRVVVPLLHYETYIPDHINYLRNLCEIYGFNLTIDTKYPETYNTMHVYVCDMPEAQGTVDIPQDFDHYWLDQAKVVIVPQKMKEIIDNREGWRVSKRGVFDIDRLLV